MDAKPNDFPNNKKRRFPAKDRTEWGKTSRSGKGLESRSAKNTNILQIGAGKCSDFAKTGRNALKSRGCARKAAAEQKVFEKSEKVRKNAIMYPDM